MITIINNHKADLGEVFQKQQIKFCFVKKQKDGNFSALMPWVLCRDFLGDHLHANLHAPQENYIYGFKTEVTDQLNLQYLAITFPKDIVINSNLDLLHTIEIKNRMKKTKIIETDDPSTIIIQFSKLWTNSIVTFSWYTFMLKKILAQLLPENMSANDQNLDEVATKLLHNLVNNITIKKIISDFPFPSKKEDIYNVHNLSGFYAKRNQIAFYPLP